MTCSKHPTEQMTETDLVALYGPRGAGKTTIARALENLSYTGEKHFHRMSLAQPIRDMLYAVIPEMYLDPGGPKEELIPGWDKSARDLLKSLGTEWGRELVHENIWVDILIQNIERDQLERVVIDDLRMRNEYEKVRMMGGVVIEVRREGADPTPDHQTEMEWQSFVPDFIINNDGSALTSITEAWPYIEVRLESCAAGLGGPTIEFDRDGKVVSTDS